MVVQEDCSDTSEGETARTHRYVTEGEHYSWSKTLNLPVMRDAGSMSR